MKIPKKLYWQCRLCKSVQMTKVNMKHSLNSCLCNKSAVDLNRYIVRFIGSAIQITKEEYDKLKPKVEHLVISCKHCKKKLGYEGFCSEKCWTSYYQALK